MSQSLDQFLHSTLEGLAGGLDAEAAALLEDAQGLEKQIAEFTTDLATTKAEAEEAAARARALRHLQDVITNGGATSQLHPEDITADGTTLLIAGSRLAPKDGSEPALRHFQEVMRALNAMSLSASHAASDRIRDLQETVTTGRIDRRDLPQPDPLTASAEEATQALADTTDDKPEAVAEPSVLIEQQGSCVTCHRPTRMLPNEVWVHVDDGTPLVNCWIAPDQAEAAAQPRDLPQHPGGQAPPSMWPPYPRGAYPERPAHAEAAPDGRASVAAALAAEQPDQFGRGHA